MSEEKKIIADINEKKPDGLFVCLGSPKQEKWIYEHKDELNVKVCLGVGGTLDVISGQSERAQEFYIKHNIEWLYRIMKEPKRFKRFYDNKLNLFKSLCNLKINDKLKTYKETDKLLGFAMINEYLQKFKEGHSIAPDLYTDKKLISKKQYFENRGKPYVYNLIYRQKRDSREPKTFDLQYLDTYDARFPCKTLDAYSLTMIDTTRKSGNDFFAMPIFKYNNASGKYRLFDCNYKNSDFYICIC